MRNSTRWEHFAPEGDHFVDQLIGFRRIRHQDASGIAGFLVAAVAQHLIQMAERLNAADQFDAEPGSEAVKVLKFRQGIAAAHIAEKRFAG